MRQTIVVESSVSAEALTINRYRCMGWELVNNQEVAVEHRTEYVANGQVQFNSSFERRIKLTFERDTDAQNFETLDDYYQQYIALENRKKSLFARTSTNLTTKQIILCYVIALIPALIIGITVAWFMADDSFWGFDDTTFAFFSFLCSVVGTAALGSVFMGIQSLRIKSRVKKKNIPAQIAAVEAEIDAIVAESAKYI